MRARRLRVGGEPIERAMGSILAADAHGSDGHVVLRKGTRLGAAHRAALAALAALDGVTLHLVDPEEGELEQDDVARRLARALAGPGAEAEEPAQGQARVRAARRGLLRVRGDAVRAINGLAPLLCFTRPSGQVVFEGDDIAGMKSAALVTSETTLREAEAIARGVPVLEVATFARRRVAVLVTDRLEATGRAMVAEAVRRKIVWFGSELLGVSEVAHEREAVQGQLRARLAEGADLLLVSGANSLDPLDSVFEAIAGLRGRVDRTGVPAHPGSMVWVGDVSGTPVLGIATCAGFGKNTALDLLLARVLAGGDPARAADELGHGGLVEGPTAIAWFPPYDRGAERAAVKEPAKA